MHPLAVRIRKGLAQADAQGKAVAFYWIRAHAGLRGNERADALAKEAALRVKRAPDYSKCPVSFIKRLIRKETLDEWNRRYQAGETASVTKIFLPDAVAAYNIIRKIKLTGTLTQVLTGHGGFSQYLHRFKCKENPSCNCDPSKEESVQHILFECPVHGMERYNAEQKLDQKINVENANAIMLDSTGREVFLKYCTNIANRVIQRNK